MPENKLYTFSKSDAGELIRLIGNSDIEFPEIVPQQIAGEGGGIETDLVYNFLAIPARVTDITGGYITRHGRQVCYRVATVQTADGELRSFVFNTSIWVYNASVLPIPEKQFLPVMKINGFWFVDQRGVQTDPPTPNPEPVLFSQDRLLDGDPIQERILI